MGQILLKNVTYLDVVNNTWIDDKFILIEQNMITQISKNKPAETVDEVIDLNNHYVLPGLIDAHVHVNAIQANLNELDQLPLSYVTPQAMKIVENMLLRGFTTIRDAAGADWGFAKAIEEGFILGPRIKFGGPALSPTGGHGDIRSAGNNSEINSSGSSLSILCDGIAEVRKAARNLIRSGADHIKIMASGGVASPTDRIDSLQFSSEEVAAIVEEAENANIYVLAHAYTAAAINRALRLGVRSIEHGNLLNEESIELFLKYDAFLVPTLITYYALKEDGLEQGLPQTSYEKISTVLETGKASIRKAYNAGINLVFGTDLLGDMQNRQLEQFGLLSEIMKPIDVIRSATINAAKLLRMEDTIGIIDTGYKADLVIYNSDPLEDLSTLENPLNYLRMIIKNGEIIKNQLK